MLTHSARLANSKQLDGIVGTEYREILHAEMNRVALVLQRFGAGSAG